VYGYSRLYGAKCEIIVCIIFYDFISCENFNLFFKHNLASDMDLSTCYRECVGLVV